VGNDIGPDGAKYIGEALKLNHVRQDSLSSSTHLSLCSSQTLTFLDLGANGIVAEGARVLADALKSNRVR
jgi:Ran GTPase-activating protein (RanGAP) involved in mRNA processing and transport